MERISSYDQLYPPFADKLVEFDKKLRELEISAYPFETFRSFERQRQLYRQGRIFNATKQVWQVVNKDLVVTNAMPGFGWHAYGLAVDYVFDGNLQKIGLQWSWDDADLTKPGKQPLPWKRLGGLGASLGLEWAGYWKHFPECPHFQSVYGLKITQVYNILINEGLPAVWKILDKK